MQEVKDPQPRENIFMPFIRNIMKCTVFLMQLQNHQIYPNNYFSLDFLIDKNSDFYKEKSKLLNSTPNIVKPNGLIINDVLCAKNREYIKKVLLTIKKIFGHILNSPSDLYDFTVSEIDTDIYLYYKINDNTTDRLLIGSFKSRNDLFVSSKNNIHIPLQYYFDDSFIYEDGKLYGNINNKITEIPLCDFSMPPYIDFSNFDINLNQEDLSSYRIPFKNENCIKFLQSYTIYGDSVANGYLLTNNSVHYNQRAIELCTGLGLGNLNAQGYVNAISNCITDGNILPPFVTDSEILELYRFTRTTFIDKKYLDEYKEGDIITFKTFISTTYKINNRLQLFTDPWDSMVIFKIKIKKTNKNYCYIEDISLCQGEGEVLLNHGLKYKITKSRYEIYKDLKRNYTDNKDLKVTQKKLVIELEVLDDEDENKTGGGNEPKELIMPPSVTSFNNKVIHALSREDDELCNQLGGRTTLEKYIQSKEFDLGLIVDYYENIKNVTDINGNNIIDNILNLKSNEPYKSYIQYFNNIIPNNYVPLITAGGGMIMHFNLFYCLLVAIFLILIYLVIYGLKPWGVRGASGSRPGL